MYQYQNHIDTEVNREYEEPPEEVEIPEIENIIGYEDIPEWCSAYFDDNIWWVSDKGEGLSDAPGRHMELFSQTSTDIVIIHEDFINGWLAHRRNIHFNTWEIEE